jgi:alanine racemase
MMTDFRRCWAEIDLPALRQNARTVRERVGAAEVMAVVKANAYGHGMAEVAQTLAREVQLFGVANLQEAIALRDVVAHPIVILGPALVEERPEIALRRFIPTVSTFEEASDFNRTAADRPVAINFKIDTGMGRVGVLENEALDLFQRLRALPGLEIHSVSTHTPAADDDPVYTKDQIRRFRELLNQIRTKAPGSYKAHALPSAGALAFADDRFDIVRVGLALYGISPLPEFQPELEPVLTWKARIGLIRTVPKGTSISYGRTFITPGPMQIGTITAGYADGYPRHLSNRGSEVLVNGRRCKLLGRVTMDLIVIDLSDVPDANVGHEVVLMGRQGDGQISGTELATRAGTIPWEIVSRIGTRVQRVYV